LFNSAYWTEIPRLTEGNVKGPTESAAPSPRWRSRPAGDRTLAELAQQYDVHPNQIVQWKTQLQEGAMDLFVTAAERKAAAPDVKALHAKIGQLAMENDFLAGALGRLPDASGKR
jgi:transposase-like protein